MYCVSSFSRKAELRAFIYGLGSSLAAGRGVSGQCREIHSNQPGVYKATRVEVNHEVIPCTISLQSQKLARCDTYYTDQKKNSKYICLCLLCLLFCSFSRVKDFSLFIGYGLLVYKVSQHFLVQLTSEKVLQVREAIIYH